MRPFVKFFDSLSMLLLLIALACDWFSALLRGEWSEAVELIMKPRDDGQFHSFVVNLVIFLRCFVI